MAPTQFDIIRRQSEAAVRNELHRAAGMARRQASLVEQASRLAGRAVRDGEEVLGERLGRGAPVGWERSQAVVETDPPPVIPAADGYMRRSPVQPVCEAADYRRRLAPRAVGVLALILAVCVGVYLLSQLGLLGR